MYKEDENTIILINNSDSEDIKTFLRNKGFSGRMISKALKNKEIYLEGKNCSGKEQVQNGGNVIFRMKDEKSDMIPEETKMEIIFEDLDILALNKKPFQLVHPTPNHPDGTLANAVAWYFKKNNIKRKIRIVNRLDRDTSGITLFAKNPYGHQQLGKQMEEGKVTKTYLAIVHGTVQNNGGTIDLPLGKHQDGIRQTVRSDGSEAITHYKVIKRFNEGTLLELNLLTGRTHQIRVHLSQMGNPIMGDHLYSNYDAPIHRQALHASNIEFSLPRSGERITLNCEIPDDMKNLINHLEISKI